MEFTQFAFWALMGLLTAAVIGIWTLALAVVEIKTQIAIALTRIDNHEDQIEKHDHRIERLELAK